MTTVVDENQICIASNDALAAWHGGFASVWAYHPTLSRLAFLVDKRDELGIDRSLLIVCTGTGRIRCPNNWYNSNISVDQSGDAWELVDASADLLVECSGVAVAPVERGLMPIDPFDRLFRPL